MSKQIPISVQISNTIVQGVLMIESSRKMTVEITQPYSGVSTLCGLSFLARMPENQDFRNLEVAKSQGEVLLNVLYEGLHHACQFHESYGIDLEALEEKSPGILEPLINIKAQLKAKFKQGNISQKHYQQQLAELKEAQIERSLKMITTSEGYMTRVFGQQFALHPIHGWKEFLLTSFPA